MSLMPKGMSEMSDIQLGLRATSLWESGANAPCFSDGRRKTDPGHRGHWAV